MKISICGSIYFMDEMKILKNKLLELGATDVLLPIGTGGNEKDLSLDTLESAQRKIEKDLITKHYNKIIDSDAILVVNHEKNGIKDYIGGNSFLEIGFAFVNKKKIFLLNPIPEMSYSSEIIGMQPTIINNDLTKIINKDNNTEEFLTEVDEHDNVIGARPKKDFFKSNHIMRSSHLFLFNDKGQMLLQKRAKTKKLYPDTYDNAVGGSVQEGESYEDCIRRETKEELGICLENIYLFTYKHFDEYNKAIKKVYMATHQGNNFKFPKREIDSVKWINIRDLKKMMQENLQQLCPPFITGLKRYFELFG